MLKPLLPQSAPIERAAPPSREEVSDDAAFAAAVQDATAETERPIDDAPQRDTVDSADSSGADEPQARTEDAGNQTRGGDKPNGNSATPTTSNSDGTEVGPQTTDGKMTASGLSSLLGNTGGTTTSETPVATTTAAAGTPVIAGSGTALNNPGAATTAATQELDPSGQTTAKNEGDQLEAAAPQARTETTDLKDARESAVTSKPAPTTPVSNGTGAKSAETRPTQGSTEGTVAAGASPSADKASAQTSQQNTPSFGHQPQPGHDAQRAAQTARDTALRSSDAPAHSGPVAGETVKPADGATPDTAAPRPSTAQPMAEGAPISESPAASAIAPSTEAPTTTQSNGATGSATTTIAGVSGTTQQATSTEGLQGATGRPTADAPRVDVPSAAELAEQVRVRLSPKRPEIVVRLDPPELGRLHIKLAMRGGEIAATVTADDARVAKAFEGDIGRLYRTLDDAGLKVSEVEIRTGLDGSDDAPREGARERRDAGERGDANGDRDGRHARRNQNDSTLNTHTQSTPVTVKRTSALDVTV